MDEYDEYVDGDGDEDEYANDDYLEERARSRKPSKEDAVSYTHLTLPTILLV